jgi:DNA-sulfur modification-associated
MSNTSTLSGYTTTYDFWGTRFNQLTLEEISLHITIDQLTSGFVQRPDVNSKFTHNRAIKLSHAEEFATYLIRGAEDTTGKWSVIVPALSLFTSPIAVQFEEAKGLKGGDEVSFGIVQIEKNQPVKIWDGQHRTLGAYIAVDRLNKQISDAHNAHSKAKAVKDPELKDLTTKLEELRKVRHRLGAIVIPVAIALETDETRIAELFADVADNAKGINATALARLDQRNVFNRVTSAMFEGVDEWTLLLELIDDENASLPKNSRFWTTYRDVASISQIAFLGYGPRWTEQHETVLALMQDSILGNVRQFFEALSESFPELDDVFTGTIDPVELRGGGSRTSLLSSSTTIKALASAWHDLRMGHRWVKKENRIVRHDVDSEPWEPERIVGAFKSLPSFDAGSDKVLNRFWKALNIVEAPYAAPTARAGNIRVMSMAVVEASESSDPLGH